MATLLSSIFGLPNCVNCRAVKSSKLIVSNHENQINHQFGRTETERNWISGESMLSVAKTTPRNLHKSYAMSGASVKQSERIPTTSTEVEDSIKASTYLFRTEFGDLVHVSVGTKNGQYVVFIEVSSSQLSKNGSKLVLSWGIFMSDSSYLVPSDSKKSTPDGIIQTTESPFVETSTGRFSLNLVFEPKLMPFYLSFQLKTLGEAKTNDVEIRNHMNKKFCVPVGFQRGQPFPLGLSFSSEGSINFSIFSRSAEGVVLCLYDDSKARIPVLELDLDPYVNRSGDVWHASFGSEWNFVNYGYRFKGSSVDERRVFLDPYSKITWKSTLNNHPNVPKYLGQLFKEPAFDWDGVICPKLPIEKLVVYRLNVMRFTAHKSSQLSADIAGTFSGVKEKLQHFKNLGVNAILFEPVFLFDDQKGAYFPCNFFSAMNLYGPSGSPVSAINSMKEMVKELHANGIEVLLEVVFTHTADRALQGIDDSCYYLGDQTVDVSLKARNALNCNFPVVQQMILDSLRYWVTEFRIDGFCFINASSLLRGSNGESLSRPPLVEAIAFDPILSKTKIIADFWDPHELIAMETSRFPHWKRWAEINTKFCKGVRDFLRGKGQISDLATRLCGSGDIFSKGRGPVFSFNFIAKNCGLPLVDLVSFSGSEVAAELSWNCGEEGPTNKAEVLQRRVRQIRNFLFLLYVSLGVPVLSMGDECGQSSGGSIAAADRNPFDWNALKTGFGIQTTQFISFLSAFRSRRADLFQRTEFWREENIDWYGSDQSPPKWEDPSAKFLAMSLKTDEERSEISDLRGDLFFVFNANDQPEDAILPVPVEGFVWHRLVDTALPYPEFFSGDGEPVTEETEGLIAYKVKANSCALFEAISCCDASLFSPFVMQFFSCT